MKKIEYIVAMDLAGNIGDGGRLPWSLPADLKRFRVMTLGRTILMGRKTYESIGRPLPGRKTLVMTRDSTWRGAGWNEDCQTVRSVTEDLGKEEDLVIVGGGEIYRLFKDQVNVVHATIVETEVISSDVKFPDIGRKPKIRIEGRHEADEKHAYAMRFETWKYED